MKLIKSCWIQYKKAFNDCSISKEQKKKGVFSECQKNVYKVINACIEKGLCLKRLNLEKSQCDIKFGRV